MYEICKETLLELFHAPSQPPPFPAGTHTSVQIFRASPRYLHYQWTTLFLGMIFLAILFLVAGGAAISMNPLMGFGILVLLILIWVLILIASSFMIHLEYDMRYYVVTDRSLRIRKGVWTILEQTLTFPNIQNLAVEQGPLERYFGISRLVIETAGGGGMNPQPQAGANRNTHRAVLNGLENAEELRDLIRDYLKSDSWTAGLGNPALERYPSGSPSRKHTLSAHEMEALHEILLEVKALRSTVMQENG